ncbi:MAG: UDP-N-acetylmuramate dehydrogenase [Patescibacteria group bacterium]
MKENVNLKEYTYLRIGGDARFFVEVTTEDELQDAVVFAKKKKLPFFILGAGSNVLVSDQGFSGIIIRMRIQNFARQGATLRVGAGMPNAVVVARAAEAGLTGIEWMIGIPGSVGGSVRGNAGCYSGEMKDVVSRVRFFDTIRGEFQEEENTFCEFGYRESIFKQHQEWVITQVELVLREGSPEVSRRFIRHYSRERARSQDIGSSSAGCLFKNIRWPKDDVAHARLLRRFPELAQFSQRSTVPSSFLIDRLGLKGKKIGHAFISPKHANFIINEGGATAEEIIILAGLIKEYVHRKFDLQLEEEIQMIGF